MEGVDGLFDKICDVGMTYKREKSKQIVYNFVEFILKWFTVIGTW